MPGQSVPGLASSFYCAAKGTVDFRRKLNWVLPNNPVILQTRNCFCVTIFRTRGCVQLPRALGTIRRLRAILLCVTLTGKDASSPQQYFLITLLYTTTGTVYCPLAVFLEGREPFARADSESLT